MSYSLTIREEELKIRVAQDWFKAFDCAKIIGDIDFCVSVKNKGKTQSFLWAEAKAGNKRDIYESLVQLVLTIGKARAFEYEIPPSFLGAFDAEKIAFLPYHLVMDVFSQNDFNWNVTPSDHDTKEFKQIEAIVRKTMEDGLMLFNFDVDGDRLRQFIKENFQEGKFHTGLEITRNNFIFVYYDWLRQVMPTINVNWSKARDKGIIDADFYLADLISSENATLKDKLYVLLKKDHYEFDRTFDEIMGEQIRRTGFKDGQKAHTQFWNTYRRPPREEYWDYIVARRDLLVPQDIRERKGSFFTPQKWVELSQQYLADTLGENYQDEFYIWDCAAGTGNLLHGLTDKYKVYASTLDQADVDVMRDRIKNGANLLDSHVFQFDFLNDPLDSPKMPESLRNMLKDAKKRSKLLIYINPPYAEAATARTISGTGMNKKDVAVNTVIYKKYQESIGLAARELFVQFLIRISKEIHGCVIGNFSTLKIMQAPNFEKFRNEFKAELKNLFIVPSWSFDNVGGQFPIGFFIWDTLKEGIRSFTADVYMDNVEKPESTKVIHVYGKFKSINDWMIATRNRENEKPIGYMAAYGSDFQHTNNIFLINDKKQLPHPRGTVITDKNIKETAIYLAVRHVITPTWLNDRDQFLYPENSWQNDIEFQNDCFAWMLFAPCNNIKSCEGVNHWIPFTEDQVGAQEQFASHFVTDYMFGKMDKNAGERSSLINKASSIPTKPLVFSDRAKAVFDAGRELWRYYHQEQDTNPNASLYDIKEHFQGRNDKGRMNASSNDAVYNELMANLRDALKDLAEQIIPKVYEHGFLKR